MSSPNSVEVSKYSQCYVLIPVPDYLETIYRHSIANPLGCINSGLTVAQPQSRHISLGFFKPLNDDALFDLTDKLRRYEEEYLGHILTLNGYGQFADQNGWISGTYLSLIDDKLVRDMQAKAKYVFSDYFAETISSKSPPHCTTGRLPAKSEHQIRFVERKDDVIAVHESAALTFSIDNLQIRGRERFNLQKTTKYPTRIDFEPTTFYSVLSPIRKNLPGV
jgi:2'-5' RNA ligase